jgi:hypothetical protein
MSYNHEQDRYKGAFEVTPSDVTVLSDVKGLWLNATGDVTVTMESGERALFKGGVAGTLIPVAVTQVKATGTVAAHTTTKMYALT